MWFRNGSEKDRPGGNLSIPGKTIFTPPLPGYITERAGGGEGCRVVQSCHYIATIMHDVQTKSKQTS